MRISLSEKLSLKIEARHDALSDITAAVEDLGQRENWGADLVFKVNLALEEMGLNIMDYGLDGGELEIELTSNTDALTIEITDNGRPFDPLNDAPEHDVTSELEDRAVGGLGIHLTRTVMDEMSYRRENGRNHLTMVARRD